MRKRYKKIGRTQRKEAIYQDVETGEFCIEMDYNRLVVAADESLEGAQFGEGVRKGENSA